MSEAMFSEDAEADLLDGQKSCVPLSGSLVWIKSHDHQKST
jgi:hypothetical protein